MLIKGICVQNCCLNKYKSTQATSYNKHINFNGLPTLTNIDYFIENKIPLTVVDNPAVLELRLQNFKTKPYTTSSIEYKSNINYILDKEFELINNTPADKKLVIVTGLPASGKSDYIKKMYGEKYYIADTDKIKKMFPAYKTGGRKYNTLHGLSTQIVLEHLIPKAISEGKNIVIPTSGYEIKNITPHAKDLGYKVTWVHILVDKETCMKRAMKRYENGGNFVDPYFIELRAPYSYSQVNALKNCPSIDELIIVENNTHKN